ncbi:hypothetical protein JB92DRAFT_2904275 [Gautieria morchelliformis]|nr:hypothetical protein JB92DRAFT_2904275 [Gautieria morchelliformis]
MARLKTHKGPSKNLSYQQRKVASKAAETRRQNIRDSVNEVLDMVDREVARLALEHKKSTRYFLEQVHQGGRFSRMKRSPNIFNGAQHAICLVEKENEKQDLEISPEDYERIKLVVERIRGLGGPEFAKDLVAEDRELLTNSIEEELHHLNARTSTEVFMFTVKGKDEHHQDGTVIMTPKAESFLVNILKLDPDRVSREFEMYTLRSAEGVVLNHNERLGELRLKIRQLIRTGLAHGIDLVGWPKDILFANPSKITRIANLNKVHATLSEGTCHWVRLTQEEQDTRKAGNLRRLNAGEDPYVPRGGQNSKTASKKRKSTDDITAQPTKKSKARTDKENEPLDKVKSNGRGNGKSKGKRKKGEEAEVIADV